MEKCEPHPIVMVWGQEVQTSNVIKMCVLRERGGKEGDFQGNRGCLNEGASLRRGWVRHCQGYALLKCNHEDIQGFRVTHTFEWKSGAL